MPLDIVKPFLQLIEKAGKPAPNGVIGVGAAPAPVPAVQ
jgi:hypothetical protein